MYAHGGESPLAKAQPTAALSHIGVYGENSRQDTNRCYAVDESGGYLLAGQAGADLYLGSSWALHLNGGIPLAQDMQGGYSEARGRWMCGVTMMF